MRAETLVDKARYSKAADLFRVLGRSRRIEVLEALRDGPLRSMDLTRKIGLSFKDITYDLGLLHDARAIDRFPGRMAPWRITPHGMALLRCFEILAALPLPEEPHGRQ